MRQHQQHNPTYSSRGNICLMFVQSSKKMFSKSPDSPALADPLSKSSFMLRSLLPTRSHGKEILRRINTYLSNYSNRLEGLEMLNVLITSCTAEQVSANYPMWLTYCCPQPRDDLKEIKLRVVRKIIIVSGNVQDFNRKFVIDYIAKVVDACISPHADLLETNMALETLSICMKHYGSWFTTHRQKIEKYLLTFLDSPTKKIVRSAAEAFLYLQQTGGAGAEGANHAQNFSSSFRKLCVTTHKLFDVLFENETEIEKYTSEEEDEFIFKDSSASLDVTAQRIENLSIFLQVMMLKGFPVVKEIKPIDVLNIVERGVHVHTCCESENFSQSALLLMNIQISLLRLMDTFIIWSETSSLPFSHKITKILIDCLEMSQKCQCFTLDSEFRRVTYKGLNTWIAVVKCGFHENFQAKLISCILKDISPVKNQLMLTVSSDSRNKSSKAKKKAVQQSVISTSLPQSDTLNLNEKAIKSTMCYSSLETLRHILYHVDLNIDKSRLMMCSVFPAINKHHYSKQWWRPMLQNQMGYQKRATIVHLYKELYHVIFQAVDSIVTNTEMFPYTDPQCQVKLFEVLPMFYEQQGLSTLPPLQLTLSILNRGLNSGVFQVSDVCEKGINTLEKICQPVCPSLGITETGRETDVITSVDEVITAEDSLALIDNGDCDDEVILNEFGVTNIIPIEPSNEYVPVTGNEDEIKEQETSTDNILDVQIISVEPDHNDGEETQTLNIETINNDSNQETPTIEMLNDGTNQLQSEPTENSNVTLETQPSNLEELTGDEPPSKVPKLAAEPTEEPFEDDSFVDVVNEY